MIEVVFSDSACGNLKVAQNYGKGEWTEGCIGVIPAEDEAFCKACEEARKDWESAVPMGGKASDVYGLHFLLSMGDIREELPGAKRLACMKNLYSIYPAGNEAACELWKNSRENLETVLRRVQQGEAVRIWYSDQPDEACGCCWLLMLLARLDHRGDVYAVKLPTWKEKDGCILQMGSWADVFPGEWSQYIRLQHTVSMMEVKRAAQLWRDLQEDNAALRAMVNGSLFSMPEDMYDSFIFNEIQAQDAEFHQARLIGSVLGKYQLGISDVWIAQRMEQMVQNGVLEIETAAPEGSPLYHRILRKACIA